MSQHVSEEVKMHVWTEAEAFRSGKGGYLIGCELSGNPFKGSLATCWENGYKDAASKDTTSKRRVDYMAEERDERRNVKHSPRPRGTGDRNNWRPGPTPRNNSGKR